MSTSGAGWESDWNPAAALLYGAPCLMVLTLGSAVDADIAPIAGGAAYRCITPARRSTSSMTRIRTTMISRTSPRAIDVCSTAKR
jgi:hypothetical protein